MASFVPPPHSFQEDCDLSIFQVYCNSILPASRRLVSWYQYVNLSIAIIAFAALLLWAILPARSSFWGLSNLYSSSDPLAPSTGPSRANSLPETKSFHLCQQQPCTHARDIHIWPGLTKGAIALVELGKDSINLPATCSGIAIRLTANSDSGQLSSILLEIRRLGLPSIVMCHHDLPVLDQLDLGLVSGLIIENACILDNGERRDYFRSTRLRKIVKKCAPRRQETPSFLLGFLELWQARPGPATIRRAYKIGTHFGAVVSTGPAGALDENPASLSAFEYLRKPEVTEVSTICAHVACC